MRLLLLILVMSAFHVGLALRVFYTAPKGRSRYVAVSALSLVLLAVIISGLVRFTVAWHVPAVVWTFYIGLGLYSFLYTFFGVKEFAWWVAELLDRPGRPTLPEDPRRRDFVAKTLNLAALTGASVVSGVAISEAVRRPRVRRVEVPVRGLHPDLDGFHIVQLSDVHVGPTIKRDFVADVVNTVNGLQPDLVALTGDFVDGTTQELDEDVAPLRDLEARYGSYFVTGNHEYYSGALPWCARMRELGARVLLNEHELVDVERARLLVGGVTDYRADRFIPSHRSDPRACLTGAPEADFKLLLAHRPRSAYRAASAGFDLQVSGHTHGGQFFPWNIVVHLIQPFVAGLMRYDGMWLYVSRGTGYVGPPYRFMAPSEITSLRLRRA